ncbi:MAG: S1 RNA-binding domain-containing protein [Anaerolineae bacterium]|nr:S1 RNA-binding domain-containing protein [Anaerolineae bacterium]MDQ7035695.1 S1 RNA-binding domain-containing protein [Anaerolineae bacterium]
MMSTDIHRNKDQRSEKPEPPVDEGYWDSLLTEGEFTRSVDPSQIHDNDAQAKNSFRIAQTPIEPIHQTAEQYADWDEATRIMTADKVLDLKVVGYNRGGLLVEWQSLRGFVPASQLLRFPNTKSENERRDALLSYVGDTLYLRVIELDPEKNRLILSERAAQVESGTRDQIFAQLTSGDTILGRVTNLCDFGAFVDLGGVEGLIHISELSWGRVGHPSDVLEQGKELTVYVLSVDSEHSRIALSIKRLNSDPWATVADRYTVGEMVTGQITNVVDFGAFACIEDGLEGLIHFSELAEGQFLHPRNVVQEGDIIQARILTIDGKARRLGLSLRLV